MNWKKFRKKPVVIEAIQLEPYEVIGWPHFVGGRTITQHEDGTIEIETLEGKMIARPGDWVVRGILGELYPVKDGIFRVTYEAIG